MATSFSPVVNAIKVTIVGDINNSTTTIVVSDASRIEPGMYLVLADNIELDEASKAETIKVTAKVSNTLTVTRNTDSLGAVGFDNGHYVHGALVAEHIEEIQTAVNTAEDDIDTLETGKENVANKATNLTSPDNTKYPTTQAVSTALAGKQDALGFTPEDSANKGQNNGYAELDGSGKVPTSQLPAFVDDVLEYANLAGFPGTGETGKIYVALDTNIVYRWSGSAYVEISASLALGETSSTAYRGDRGKIAYDHSQVTTGNPHSVTATEVGLGNVDNTSDANKPVSTATQTALDAKQDILAEGAFVDGDKTKLDNIEENADVTDTANVTAAGALMESEVTNLEQVKAFDSSDYATSSQGALADSAVQPGDLATVATSGDYNDLSNTPDLSVYDEVEQYANLASFPATGDSAKFYLAQDTGTMYRWNGASYAVISAQLALGETSSTAYRGDRGKTAYDHSQVTTGNPHSVTAAEVGNTTAQWNANQLQGVALDSTVGTPSDGDILVYRSAGTDWVLEAKPAGGGNSNHSVDVVSNVATNTILGRVTAGSGDSEELTATQVRTLINVEDGATADQTDAEIKTAVDNELAGVTVGTTDTQTLTNKTLTTPIITTPTISFWDGWDERDESLFSYASATTITTSSDQTGNIQKGDKLKVVSSGGGTDYFFVTDINATTITVYGGTDYAVHNSTFTEVAVSRVKAPFGFPLDPDKWSVTQRRSANDQTSSFSASSGTVRQIDNLTSMQVPIGVWNAEFSGAIVVDTSSVHNMYYRVFLSESATSSSNAILGSGIAIEQSPAGHIRIFPFSLRDIIVLTSSKTYYPDMRKDTSGSADLAGLRGDYQETLIRFTIAYL